MFLEMNKMNGEDIIRVYPVIDDDPEKIYEKLAKRVPSEGALFMS